MVAGLTRAFRAIWAYFDAPTPRGRIAATVAMIIVSNQPFYPLYLYGLLGTRAWPALLSWLSAPFFAAVPAVLRRRSETAGGWLLIAAGLGNTVLCALALGPRSAVELFYLPCLALPVLVLEGRPRRVAMAVTVVVIATAFIATRLSGLDGLTALSPEEAAGLSTINALSVAGLLGMMAFISRGLWSPGPGTAPR